jgi:D-sedoheptulose 7-phosphate isomerase
VTFQSVFQEHIEAFLDMREAVEAPINRAAEAITRTLARGGKVMLCGNGGSAADAQHIAAELIGRFQKERKPYAAIALTTDSSALTAIGNDYHFNEVFSRQVHGLGRVGDCLIAISTSGNSQNVLRAVKACASLSISTVGLLGKDGGDIAQACDIPIVVPSKSTARVQEAHGFIGHVLCEIVEESLGGEPERAYQRYRVPVVPIWSSEKRALER